MKIEVQPVILCGGSGTRLWPVSRAGFPKQFLSITGNESLFQQAVSRLVAIDADGANDIIASDPFIVSGEQHRFLVQEQLREIDIAVGATLLEPIGRNTAPALTLAALCALQDGTDPVLVVTPADQTIVDKSAFIRSIQEAVREAATGNIVILGIVPERPETGYGYIQIKSDSSFDQKPALAVRRFAEKPDANTAQGYLDQGSYFWNAGMFVLKASVWMAALECFRPDIAQATRQAWEKRTTDGGTSARFIRPGIDEFTSIPADSVDYAVMEHCPDSDFTLKMVPLVAGWSDLGSWDSVWRVLPKDKFGNAHLGDVVTSNSQNTFVHATSRLVTLFGVNDLVVIESPDVVLVVDQGRCQDVKSIMNQLQSMGRGEFTQHRKVHRSWGWYDIIEEAEYFKVKRIQVNPKASLSLQKHHHRAEHWIVVKGTAEVTNGNKTFLLSENQSTYIPLGEVHRLANPGNIPLEIIEVQSGSYLTEDDIVRFKDNYGRA